MHFNELFILEIFTSNKSIHYVSNGISMKYRFTFISRVLLIGEYYANSILLFQGRFAERKIFLNKLMNSCTQCKLSLQSDSM